MPGAKACVSAMGASTFSFKHLSQSVMSPAAHCNTVQYTTTINNKADKAELGHMRALYLCGLHLLIGPQAMHARDITCNAQNSSLPS